MGFNDMAPLMFHQDLGRSHPFQNPVWVIEDFENDKADFIASIHL
jgi:hypothetical protein